MRHDRALTRFDRADLATGAETLQTTLNAMRVLPDGSLRGGVTRATEADVVKLNLDQSGRMLTALQEEAHQWLRTANQAINGAGSASRDFQLAAQDVATETMELAGPVLVRRGHVLGAAFKLVPKL